MAKGRIISNEIARDKKINDLSCDTSRLAFTWLVTFADCEGRTYGDPAVVKSMLFPRREDVTSQMMLIYITEWHEAGLINWYEAEGDWWIEFPNFDKHQPHLRKDRETPSHIPSYSGVTPEQLPVKLTEVKLTESKLIKEVVGENSTETGNLFKKFQENISPITPAIRDKLLDAYDTHGFTWVDKALDIAIDNSVHNWAYIQAILDRWKSQGYGTDPPGYKKNGKNGSQPIEAPIDKLIREEKERAKGQSP